MELEGMLGLTALFMWKKGGAVIAQRPQGRFLSLI
jgi:hypothetical protein